MATSKPPATGQQIAAAAINNIDNSRTVNFSGNFAGQPQITDSNTLLEILALAG